MINLQNILANGLARFFSIGLNFFLAPIFITYLGYDAYGLIGFYAFVSAAASLLEMGFPLALNRATARFTGGEKTAQEMSSLIKVFEISFFLICAVIILLGLVCGPLLAGNWLSTNNLDISVVEKSVYLIFILIGIRFPIGLYLAILAGLQKQVKMNLFIMTFTLLRLGGASLAIIFWNTDILLFFQIQICVSLMEYAGTRYSAWASNIDFSPKAKVKFSIVKDDLKIGIRIGGLSLIAVLIGQLDKALTSGFFDLYQFGLYSIATIFGLGITTIGYPIASAAFPHFAKAGYESQTKPVDNSFVTYYLIAIVFILAISVPVFTHLEELLIFYLGTQNLPSNLLLITKIMIIGGFFGGLVPIPYSFITASGSMKKLYKLYGFLVLTYPALLYILIHHHGLVGAATSFALLQVIIYFYVFYCAGNQGAYTNYPKTSLKFIIFPLITALSCSYSLDYIFELSAFEFHILFKLMITLIFIVFILATPSNLITRIRKQSIQKI